MNILEIGQVLSYLIVSVISSTKKVFLEEIRKMSFLLNFLSTLLTPLLLNLNQVPVRVLQSYITNRPC
jgi:hypothetical protein